MAVPETMTLADILTRLTREGELYEKLPDRRLRCYACGHRCVIPEGRPGVCKVRFNRDGVLYVPAGYVGALQCDPIEKKPFFHALPGSLALSFGMLGCDYHCGYCFSGDVRVPTTNGMVPIQNLFDESTNKTQYRDGVVGRGMEELTYGSDGNYRRITKVFRHPYRGPLLTIKAKYLPPFRCTPEHPVLAAVGGPRAITLGPPSFVEAKDLTNLHWLCIPRRFAFSSEVMLDVPALIAPHSKSFRVRRTIHRETIEAVLKLTQQGLSSRVIGTRLGMDPSHVRHLRSKVRRGVWNLESLGCRKGRVVEEKDQIRFSNEHKPGIPAQLQLTEEFARLLGYYCAEGCVIPSQGRVQAGVVVLAFGKREARLIEDAALLFEAVFGIRPSITTCATSVAVSLSKASVAALFEALAGGNSRVKRVPAPLFRARREVTQSFIDGYVAGDGYRSPNRSVTISTVSEELAWGVAWLVEKLGHVPAVHRYPNLAKRKLLGRAITQAPETFMVRWYPDGQQNYQYRRDATYYYVPVDSVSSQPFEGYVYNLEVDGDHTYLANGIATHNCQNWVTSQALRDPKAVSAPELVSPDYLVGAAEHYGAPIIASTYNEPLITSEWAVEIFRLAKQRGLKTAYISNGNGTPQVIEYLKPWVDLYKVDLKGFNDLNYRKLGGVLQNVLDTIRLLVEKQFWVEIVTLVVPGFNDADAELTQIAEFLASVSVDLPWHVTAFHQDYKMRDRANTTAKTLLRAAEIGRHAGLHYVYAGNLPGRVGPYEHTFCPSCQALCIERAGYAVLKNVLEDGACPACRTSIPGVWR
jgi:pyruvate formate lyase activating enzyme